MAAKMAAAKMAAGLQEVVWTQAELPEVEVVERAVEAAWTQAGLQEAAWMLAGLPEEVEVAERAVEAAWTQAGLQEEAEVAERAVEAAARKTTAAAWEGRCTWRERSERPGGGPAAAGRGWSGRPTSGAAGAPRR
jgi:hypothetical protein